MAASKGDSKKATSGHPDWKEDVEQVNYMSARPHLHLLKKPSWAKERSALDIIEPVQYEGTDGAGVFWRSVISFPMIFLLALPLLALLSITLPQFQPLPDSITPHLFQEVRTDSGTRAVLAGFWVLGLIAFVPWSGLVCRMEDWLSKYI